MKKDTAGKTNQGRRGRGGEGAAATQGHSGCTVSLPLEVWSTKKTSAMTKRHAASGEHAVREEEEEEEATEFLASPQI